MFFQLEAADEDRLERVGKGFPKGKEMVIQFISQAFIDTEGRYLDIKRECLAIFRALEEVRFLALQSRWPVTVYTDTVALVSILQKDDARGRIAGWQVRLAEYEIVTVVLGGVAGGVARGAKVGARIMYIDALSPMSLLLPLRNVLYT